MSSLFRNNWPLLWTPNADELQGSPEGLLRADNLMREEDGSLSLIRGTFRVSSDTIKDAGGTNHPVYQIYSKTMDLYSITGDTNYEPYCKVRYLVAKDKVIRNWGPTQPKQIKEIVYDVQIGSGVSPEGQPAAFGFGFGHVFICYGNIKKKDNGKLPQALGSITDIGLPPANPPFSAVGIQPFLWVSPKGTPPTDETYQYWEGIETGGVFGNDPPNYDYVKGNMSTTNNRCILGIGNTNIFAVDTTNYYGQGNWTDEDIFSMNVRIANTNVLTEVVISFHLWDPSVGAVVASDSADYYQFKWTAAGTQFNQGTNQWTTLTCHRKDFERVGPNIKDTQGNPINWGNVRGIKVTFNNSEYNDQEFVINQMKFIGSTGGPLEGQYTYVQVDVQNNGFYLEKSRGSGSTPIVEVHKSTIRVKPFSVNPNANECWIYRYGGTLQRYYLVKKLTGVYGFDPPEFQDNVSEETALQINEPLDEFIGNLPDGIIGMECNWKGRNWYITNSTLYPSSATNPSVYDMRWVIETASRNAEINYFITRLSHDTMILATSGDFYEITGTGGIITQDDIDFFDINIKPLGIKSPAISTAFTVREGNLFYVAADGVRVLSGSNCQSLMVGIDRLIKNESCHGIFPLRFEGLWKQRYYLAISKNRLFFSTVVNDQIAQGTFRRKLLVFDFVDKQWRYEDHTDTSAIGALWAEDDDVLLGGMAHYVAPTENYIKQLDSFHSGLHNSAGFMPIPFEFRTVWDPNQQPRQRKESYTFKINCWTDSSNVNILVKGYTGIALASDSNQELTLLNTTINNVVRQEHVFQIHGMGTPVKYYQVKITGSSLNFKLFNFSIDYDEFPVQLTALRVANTTYGVAGRKRIYEIPFVINTLGNTVRVIPVLDSGVYEGDQLISSFDKVLTSYLFKLEQISTNVGLLLKADSGVFEFYEMIKPREIEVLPDPVKFKFVPYTNLGNTSRKRWIQYALVVDTRDEFITMTPILDGVEQTPLRFRTNRKQSIVYTFNHFAIGTEIACKLSSDSGNQYGFEFYEVDVQECVTEKLPAVARYFHIPTTNFGTSSRKRFRQFAFVCDTLGSTATFTPYIDGVAQPFQHFSTNFKNTVIYTFDSYAIGIDIGGTIECSSHEFHFYAIALEDCVYEKLPPIASHIVIPYNNFNTSSRKKFRQFSITIDTRGQPVEYTPMIDGSPLATQLVNTDRKETVIYTPENGAIGIDLGGTLRGNFDFEFYGLNLEDAVYEKLPAKTQFMDLGCTNYGIAAKKRIRTIPMVLNTFGHDVIYTPKVDGVEYPTSTFNTTDKSTVLHYFTDQGNGTPFGIDYCGTLRGDFDFEFYQLLKPENVELLPVGKKYDQFGPLEFNKTGKIREISIRMVHTGDDFHFVIYTSDYPVLSGKVLTMANIEKCYVISCPKGVNPNIFRMEISSDKVFHRFDCFVKVNIDGAQTQNKWIKVK